MRCSDRLLRAAALLFLAAGSTTSLADVTTAFTYQGELAEAGAPVTGTYDMQFSLMSDSTGGTILGTAQCANDVQVVNGKFTVVLDFGAQFNGQSRFLEIQVRADSGADCTDLSDMVALSPRQELTASPNAAFALNAATASTATTATNALSVGGQPASNVALLSGDQTFTGVLNFTNPGNTFNGTFAGNAAGLTGMLGNTIAPGTLSSAQLDAALQQRVPALTLPGMSSIASIPGSHYGFSVAVEGGYIFEVRPDTNQLRVYSTTAPYDAVVAPITTDAEPYQVRAANGRVYVINRVASTMQVFDAQPPFALLGQVSTADSPRSMCIADGRVYTMCKNGGPGNATIRIFDAAPPFAQIGTDFPSFGEGGGGILVADGYLFALNDYSWTAAVFEAAPPFNHVGSVAGGAELFNNPRTMYASGGLLYITGGGDGGGVMEVYSTSPPFAQVGDTVTIGTTPGTHAAFSLISGGVLYVTHNDGLLRAFNPLPPFNLLGSAPFLGSDIATLGQNLVVPNYLLGGTPLTQILAPFDAGGYSFASPAGLSIGTSASAPFGGLNVAGASSFGGGLSVTGTITGTSFSGSGAGLTNLNAANVTGTLGAAQIPNLDASKITTGTLSAARMPSNWAAGGALSGFYPSPSIAAGAVSRTSLSADLQSVMGVSNLTGMSLAGSLGSGGGLGIAVSGNYAYVAKESGALQVINVSNPTAPAAAGPAVSTNGLFSNAVGLSGNYAYVVNHDSANFQVFNVSNPASPVPVGSPVPSGGSHPISIAVSGSSMYIVNRDSNNFTVFDLTNPAAPTLVATVAGAGNVADSISVQGSYAYVTAYGAGLRIYDVSNPASPTFVGGTATAANPWCVHVSGTTAYVSCGAGATGTLQIFNVANPASPTLLGSAVTNASPRGVALQGSVAIVTSYSASTVQLYNVANPASPTLMATIPTSGGGPGPLVVNNGIAYVPNRFGGLDVFQGSLATQFATPISSTSFSGSGAGLTDLNATNVTGTLGTAQIPSLDAAKITSGTLNSAQIPSLDAAKITTGTIADNRLPAKLARTDQSQTFSGVQTGTFAGPAGGDLTGMMPNPTIANGAVTLSKLDSSLSSLMPVSQQTSQLAILSTAASGGGPFSVAVAGQYAFMTSQTTKTLQRFDISNPAAPVAAGSVSTQGTPYSIALSGNKAYVASRAPDKIEIFDISSAPTALGSAGAGLNPFGIAVAGSYAYIGGDINPIRVMNISNPASPTLVTTLPSLFNYAHSLTVVGSRLYIGSISNSGLYVYDLTDPASPAFLGSAPLGFVPECVAISGSYAYVVGGASNMQVFDITGSTPIPVGTATTGGSPNSIVISGTKAYVAASGSNTVQVFDISTPATPTLTTQVTAGTYPRSVAMAGSNIVIANANSSSLQVAGPTYGVGFNQTLLANNRVGIGTSTPGATLEIAGGPNTTPQLLLNQNLTTWGTVAAHDAFRYIATTGGDPALTTDKPFHVGAGGVSIGYPNNVPVYGSGDALYVRGGVGIGNTSPAAMVDVSGNLRVRGGGSSYSGGGFLEYNRNGGDGATWLLSHAGSGAGGIRFGAVDSTGTATEFMRITANGRVGINSAASPAAYLYIPSASPVTNSSIILAQMTSSTGASGHAAVRGEDYSTSNLGTGVLGRHYGFGYGVVGLTNTGVGVLGQAFTSGLAGQFFGNVSVSGSLSKGGGSFKIDHPLDPENQYLYHSFVESPDMMNIYNGNISTDSAGYATITLPDYFEALNRDFRYQLTVLDEGTFALVRVSRKIEGNTFEIATNIPNVEVSWQVTGIRHDAWAEKNRIPNAVPKPASEKGKYLHPEAFGKTVDEGVAPAAAALAPATASH